MPSSYRVGRVLGADKTGPHRDVSVQVYEYA